MTVLAGCGARTEPARPVAPELLPDGTASIAAFADYQRAVEEDWERDPVDLASAFLGSWLDGYDATETAVRREGDVVVATHEGLADDSIEDQRVVVTVRRVGDGYELVSAHWAQRCRAGRGHRSFSPRPCV